MKFKRNVFCLLASILATGGTLAQSLATGTNTKEIKQIYTVEAPDGKTYEIQGPPGATQEEALREVLRQSPEAAILPPSYDLDYFNSCVLKDLDRAKSELAVMQLNQVCKHKATPKRCRSLAADRDRAPCVKSCKEAGYFSNTVGDCSKG